MLACSTPRLTVITATFNSEENILDCLKSIQRQSYQNFEHIIIDGASYDNTLKIIKKYSDSRTKVYTEKDSGIYNALNKGLKLASGDIVGFLHSDDMFYSNNTLRELISRFDKDNVLGVYGDLNYVDKKYSNKVVRHWESGKFQKYKLFLGWMPPHPTLFIRNSVYHDIGLFDESYKISSDYNFCIKAFVKYGEHFEYINNIITTMRVGGVSNNNMKNIILKSKEDFKITQSITKFIPLRYMIICLKNILKLKQIKINLFNKS